MEQKLNDLMKQYQVSFQQLATTLGISKQTLTRKFKGTTEWTYEEMMSLSKTLHIEDPQQFFFE